MRCQNCGTENIEGSKFCRECGTALTAEQRPQTAVAERELSFAEKVELIRKELQGLDCGRCGYESCAENAEAIVRGESPYDSCAQASPETCMRIRQILGLPERSPLGLRIWWLLTSVKLAIGLIIALAVLSIIGTLIPQGRPAVWYLEQYGDKPLLYNLIVYLKLDRLYHTGYYLGLLALLGINTLACLTKRFRVSLQLLRAPLRQAPAQLLRLENSAELPTASGASQALEKVAEVLRSRGYRLERQGAQLRARRHIFGRLGVDLFHASLVLLLIGAIVGGLFGFEGFIAGNKGDILDVPGAEFKVRIDDLWTENYPGTTRIKDWYTKLTVIDGGKEVLTKTIEVNHPLTYKGVSFYQSSFGTDWLGGATLTFAVERAEDGSPLGEHQVEVGESFTLDAGLEAKLVAFYPHLVMTKLGPRNRSLRLENPAAYLEIYEGDVLRYWGWTFAHFPEVQLWRSAEEAGGPMGHGATTFPYNIKIVGMHAPEFTGLQVSYNPGIWIIYLSFAMMTLGMLLNFYMPPRWVWAAAERGRLILGGMGRDDREFMGEFEGLLAQVRAALGEAEAVPPKERVT